MKKKQEPIRVAQIMGKWLGGGVESVVMNYYRHIDRNKVQFDFICDEDSKYIPREEIESLGGKIILIPPYQKPFKYHKELKRVLKNGNYKIVHSHISTMSFFSLWAAKSAKVPVRIAHAHSTTHKQEKKKNLMKQVLRPFSKVFATDYFCCSELAGRWLFGNKTYDQGKVYLLNNAIDVDKFKYDEKIRKAKRKELKIKDKDLVIGHIGRFVQQKNHIFLIDIFNEVHKQNKNTVLLLAGEGPLKQEIENKVKSLGLEKNVMFLGQRNDANELYQAMDVFLLPSLYEGLPVVGVEAQAAGLPCFFSTDMTKETKVLKTTRFITLDQLPKDWGNIILKNYRKFKRQDTTEEITEKSFNIKKESSKLESKYDKLSIPKKIKVLHLISTDVFSGAENVACQIIKQFEKDNKYDMVYCAKMGTNKTRLKELNVKIRALEKFNYIQIKKVVKKFNPDIIHAHDAKASVLASRFCRNRKIISHIHGNHENMRKRTIKSVLFKSTSKKYNKIIWVSNSALDNYFYKKNIEKKSIVLYNVVDSNAIRESINKDKGKYNYDLVYLGRLNYPKNPERLIEIINEICKKKKDLKVAIIGDGDLRTKIEKSIKKFNLEKNISMFGFVNNPYKILDSSKLMIMTSRYEGTPMCALEAISLGKPIISTPTDGLCDLIDNGKNGILSNNNKVLAKETLKLLNNKQAYQRMSKCMIDKNNEINNMTKYISIIKNIYEEDLNEK